MASKLMYPVYIISKGRYDCALTANNFEKAGIDYLIVVEPQEYELYCKSLGKHRVLKLPFSNLGLGSYPARNFCWEHAKANNHKYHFLFVYYHQKENDIYDYLLLLGTRKSK